MTTGKRIRRRTLNDRGVRALRRKQKRFIVADPEQRGHYLRVPPHGPITFTTVSRNRFGRQVWAALGTSDTMKIDEARELCRTALRRVKDGKSPLEPPKLAPEAVAKVCEAWLQRVVRKSAYRTASEKERIVSKYIVPAIGDRVFTEIRRSDIASLLDHIEDENGKHQADAVLSVLRAVGTWVARRDDSYALPFIRGMGRTSHKERQRDRILSDDELRRVWAAADDTGVFGALVRLLLLTGQRVGVVIDMSRSDIKEDGTWVIPLQPRAKGHGGTLKLPAAALAVLDGIPRWHGTDRVFLSANMNLHEPKRKLDDAANVHGWVLHDLRRSARSLLSRALVAPHIAERVLGHVQPGVAGVYDRHGYTDEKADALRRLSNLIETILREPTDAHRVVNIKK